MLLKLDGQGPLWQQLSRAIETSLGEGSLPRGGRLPSTRELAASLRLGRNTVRSAYDDLTARGVIAGRRGAGSFVLAVESRNERPRAVGALPAQTRFAARTRLIRDVGIGRLHSGLRFNLQYGEPFTDARLPELWRRELARAAVYAPLGYPPSQGLPELRRQIARYLAERRGMAVEPDDVLVVAGAQQALSLAARVLIEEDAAVAIEDPGYFGARWVLHAHGARLLPVAVDRAGLVTQRLPAQRPALVYTTPCHQFPLGVVMSQRRRQELLDYARRHRTWIVEDDYDAEVSLDGFPTPPLYVQDGGQCVIHVGTFSKVLAPSLRLAYIVMPKALRGDFVAAKRIADLGSPRIEQAALAQFLAGGQFRRHLQRVVRAMRARRNALVAGLRRHAGRDLQMDLPSGGMHIVAWRRPESPVDIDTLIEAAADLGVGLYPLAPHYLSRPPRQGLLLGYAGTSPAEITAACRLLGTCLERLREAAAR